MGDSIGIGKRMIRLDTVDSTNTYASQLLKNQTLAEGTVILADYQSAGRGQAGNHWVSEPGKNLTFSIVLYPETLEISRQFYLSMAISNGILALLGQYDIVSKVKWPNDICIREKKIAGILIENAVLKDRIRHSVAGIGININQLDFPEHLESATSMCRVSGTEYETCLILNVLLKHISSWVQKLYEGHYIQVKAFYMDRLKHLNEWRSYKDATGLFEGKIVDVAESGELMVMRKTGEIRPYAFKEIIPVS